MRNHECRRHLAALLMVLMGTSALVGAHHSFAAIYDQSKPLHLQGRVENVEWKNPPVTMTLVSRAADGTETRWALEMGAPDSNCGLSGHSGKSRRVSSVR